jgi:hypothetical protein
MADTTDGGAPGSTPAVIVHALVHARAATAVRPDVLLLSAPGAGIYAGAGWFAALVRAADGRACVLDCGDDAGAVLAAFRAGIPAAVFTGPAAMADRLAAVAQDCGARVLAAPPPALDLAGYCPTPWWQARLAAHLSGAGG